MRDNEDWLGSVGPSMPRLPEERVLTENHAVLWTVIITAAVLDVITTMVGLGIGLAEGNTVARAFIATYGLSGIGWLKFAALVVLVLTWAFLPDRRSTVVLHGFALVSLLVVALNAVTLAIA